MATILKHYLVFVTLIKDNIKHVYIKPELKTASIYEVTHLFRRKASRRKMKHFQTKVNLNVFTFT